MIFEEIFMEREKEAGEELDDEYLPACCRNGKPHNHPT